MVIISVRYRTKPCLRDAFVKALADERIAARTRTEPGNLAYEFSVPIDEEDTVCLLERWESADALLPHPQQPHFLRLQELKAQFVAETKLLRYDASPL